MSAKCVLCLHKDVEEINRKMVLHAVSCTKIAEEYGCSPTTANNHRHHITDKLALARERREHAAADRLLDDTEHLWQESLNVLEESKRAVRTMAITEGKGKSARTVYKEYKDIGPVISAIKLAHENRRLFGDATGAIKQSGQSGPIGIFLSIGLPRMDDPQGPPPDMSPNSYPGPTIEATGEEVLALDSEETVLSTVPAPPEIAPKAEVAPKPAPKKPKRDMSQYRTKARAKLEALKAENKAKVKG